MLAVPIGAASHYYYARKGIGGIMFDHLADSCGTLLGSLARPVIICTELRTGRRGRVQGPSGRENRRRCMAIWSWSPPSRNHMRGLFAVRIHV